MPLHQRFASASNNKHRHRTEHLTNSRSLVPPLPSFAQPRTINDVLMNMQLQRRFLAHSTPYYVITITATSQDDIGRWPSLATEHDAHVQVDERVIASLTIGRWLAWVGEWGIFRCFGYRTTASPYSNTAGLLIAPMNLVDVSSSSHRCPPPDLIDDLLRHQLAAIPEISRCRGSLTFGQTSIDSTLVLLSLPPPFLTS